MPDSNIPTTSLIIPIIDALRAEILAAVTSAGPSEERTVAACKAAVEATAQEYLFSPEHSLNRAHARQRDTAKDVLPRLVSRALRKLMTQSAIDAATQSTIDAAVAKAPAPDALAEINTLVEALRSEGMGTSESQAIVREALGRLAALAKAGATVTIRPLTDLPGPLDTDGDLRPPTEADA